MIRRCDGADSTLDDGKGNPCECGAEFDDVYHLVIYPHERFIPSADAQRLLDEIQTDTPGTQP